MSKLVKISHCENQIVLLDRLSPKKNCPVRQTFGKIVLLDRRPTRQTPLEAILYSALYLLT